MMKKVLVSLLMAVVSLPALFAQANDGQVIKIDTVTTCGQYTWPRNNTVYSNDTVTTLTTGDTTFILYFTKLLSYVDTAEAQQVTGNCSATWNDVTFTSSRTFFDTLTSTMGCDSVVKIEVKIALDDSVIVASACGSYTAPWGTVYTESTDVEETIVEGDCEMNKHLTLTVNPTYSDINVEVEAGCNYTWGDMVITDNEPHTLTLTTAAGCDSVVTLTVTAFTGMQVDTVHQVACDFIKPDWRDTIFETGVYTNSYNEGDCEVQNTLDLVIVKSNNDTLNTEPEQITAGCFYMWGTDTITNTDVHYKLFKSTVGGCDSLAAIQLAFTGVQNDTSFVSYCGATYRWSNYNKALPNPGNTYDYTTDTTVSVLVEGEDGGCSTRYTLVLTMVNEYDTINKYYCGEEWVYGTGSGNDKFKVENPTTHALVDGYDTLRASGYYSQTADGRPYIYVKSTSTQCRTMRTVHLTLRNPEKRNRPTDAVVTACDEYSFKADSKRGDKHTFTNKGTEPIVIDTVLIHYEHSQNQSGTGSCYDSIAHLVLTLNTKTITDTVVSECDSFKWMAGDEVIGIFTTSGEYRDTLDARNEYNCLKIANLKLTINYTPTVDIEGDWMLQPGESTVLHAVPTAESAPIRNYAWYMGNSNNVVSTSDSLVLTNVTANTDVRLQSTSTTNCTATNWITVTSNLGIGEVESLNVNVYPNPASRFVTIECTEALRGVEVYNEVGQQLVSRQAAGNSVTIDLAGLASGHYTLRVNSADGKNITRKIIVNK